MKDKEQRLRRGALRTTCELSEDDAAPVNQKDVDELERWAGDTSPALASALSQVRELQRQRQVGSSLQEMEPPGPALPPDAGPLELGASEARMRATQQQPAERATRAQLAAEQRRARRLPDEQEQEAMPVPEALRGSAGDFGFANFGEGRRPRAAESELGQEGHPPGSPGA
eukprot:CAMPEP_0179855466 /NCGR_PEP_ID=MMETSP0982-20121206/10548_1 /TAXON_ID=483367 /ORGANISM="non described non described, Strain CCMP 2436" /LENGTH=170 /DNA_ID=CAMNT_0021741553 /DNA_START=114 /DNA_END=626 /DNA_ORIENTATION=+